MTNTPDTAANMASEEPDSSETSTPSVLFVCVKNGGKSQMAAALMRQLAGSRVQVHSAGTAPGTAVNAVSAQVIAEAGADMSAEHPTPIDPALMTRVDRTVILGSEATVEPVPGMRGSIEVWHTDEPSHRGIDGIERMRLIRDDIQARCQTLLEQLLATPDEQIVRPSTGI